MQYDRLMGIVSTDQIKTVPPPEWDRHTVHEIMLPPTDDNTILVRIPPPAAVTCRDALRSRERRMRESDPEG